MNPDQSKRFFRTRPPTGVAAMNTHTHAIDRLASRWPLASVSASVMWEEVERGAGIDDFRVDNTPPRIRSVGDLWAPLLIARGRFRLDRLFLRR
jgi:hypothetical protein